MKYTIPKLGTVIDLIHQQAHLCFGRQALPHLYEYQDLFQDGIVKYYETFDTFDGDYGATYNTFFVTVLKNMYAYRVRNSYRVRRETQQDCDKQDMNTSNTSMFDYSLSDDAEQLVNMVLEPDDSFEKILCVVGYRKRQRAIQNKLGWSDKKRHKVFLEIRGKVFLS